MMEYTFQDFEPQGEEISALYGQIEQGKMVHALLISGEPGTGKRSLADLLARTLLCTSPGRRPCGKCGDCLLSSSDEHPDLIRVEKGVPLSEETRKGRSTIPVDDIREVIRICSRYPFKGGNRVILIPGAEDMTPQAQNCLLKILEEPPRNTFFLLTSSHPEQLLVTIRSRCRPLKMKPWPDSTIRKILAGIGTDAGKTETILRAASGSIGKARALAEDDAYWAMRDEVREAFFSDMGRSGILKVSTAWKDRKQEAEQMLDILEDDVRTLLLIRLNLQKDPAVESFSPAWIRFAHEAGPERFAALQQRVSEARKQLSFNVNFQAVTEQLLLTFIGERDLWVM